MQGKTERCGVCSNDVTLKADGNLRAHLPLPLPRTQDPLLANQCDGSNKKPGYNRRL